MSLLTSDEFLSCDFLCSELIHNPEILFLGFVNNKGRMVTCRNDSLTFHNEKSIEMFVMEIALDFSMKNEFNDVLGNVEYSITKRKNTNIVCIPMDQLILVIVADNHAGIDEIVKKVYPIMSKLTKTEIISA